ncbi:MAG TPA: metalloregulator ArsR/SmtB family transcription factor [Candidatus Paceibacterota bacterium]|nr:metalloregulator ArsR/SmtB family transcription factor [Candidatus Pacearchaeota archaeon]HRZ51231.1 metalloregulator ArsR/SmtB family transcription factor [Candidatus Paceibacterota bacterium]HSA36953.1 metalloregulator ArsR/SmtB family transcription factor [Candidatus Paceibacterota bacterium]
MDKLEKILKAFASRRRLAIVRYLLDGRFAPVGDIAAKIGLSLKSTSKHLIILYNADILEREQKGPQMYYKIAGNVERKAAAILKLL